MKDIGLIIREVRKRRKITQGDLCESSGLSQTYLSQIEGGTRSPAIKSLNLISGALHIPLPVLMFITLEEADIDPEKVKSYRELKPAIDALIKEFFLQ